jgi:hypothetical protein
MNPTRSSSPAIARYTTSAVEVLSALDENAEYAAALLREDDAETLHALLEKRDVLLTELNAVIETLAHESARDGFTSPPQLAEAAARALESHARLMARVASERDRLGAALERSKRPDAVAHQYTASAPRSAGLSVTG